jgi:hypothetical protein
MKYSPLFLKGIMIFSLWCMFLAQSSEVDFIKSYAGKDGQRLELVLLKPKEANKALLRVTRTDTVFDEVVFEASVKRTSGTNFLIRYRGDEYSMVSQSHDETRVYLPPRKELVMKFSKEGTDDMKAETLMDALKQQKLKNVQAGLARKEWTFLEKKNGAKATAAAESLSKRCKVAAKLALDWPTFPDAVMAETDAWSLCAPLEELSCAKIKLAPTLSCRFGEKMAFDNGVFSTTKDGATQGAAFVKGIK